MVSPGYQFLTDCLGHKLQSWAFGVWAFYRLAGYIMGNAELNMGQYLYILPFDVLELVLLTNCHSPISGSLGNS